MVVVVVLMKTQKSKRTPGSDSYNTTPGKIAASQNRTRYVCIYIDIAKLDRKSFTMPFAIFHFVVCCDA